jgi:hypothetical protein
MLSPSAEAAAAHAAGPSTAPPVQAPQPRPERPRHPPADLAHTPSAPGASPASPASDAAPPVRHATAPSWLGTPGCRCAWPHGAVARATPSIPPVPAAGQPPALHSPGLAAAQSPRAPQTKGIVPSAALTNARASMVASRPPPETSGTRPPPTPPRRPPWPNSTVPPQSTSRTVVGPHAGLLPGGQAKEISPAKPDPNAADQPSQLPSALVLRRPREPTLHATLTVQGIRLALIRTHGRVRDLLRRDGLADLIGDLERAATLDAVVAPREGWLGPCARDVRCQQSGGRHQAVSRRRGKIVVRTEARFIETSQGGVGGLQNSLRPQVSRHRSALAQALGRGEPRIRGLPPVIFYLEDEQSRTAARILWQSGKCSKGARIRPSCTT